MNSTSTNHGLMSHLLVPVANVEDAHATAQALAQYSPQNVTVLHVVEKGEGVPDKTPVEQSETMAEKSFAAFRDEIPSIDEEITYRRDVVAAIIDVAADIEASAIAFRPQGSSRIVKFLAGDKSLRLISEADRPVISLPRVGDV